MSKPKSAVLLALLFGLAWAATFCVVAPIPRWAFLAKVETPHWFGGGDITPSLWMIVIVALVLWLARDQIGRALAVLGATASLLFCVLNAQAALWYWMILRLALARPPVAVTYGPDLWIQIFSADVAFTLSVFRLWLCARIVGPKQARPLASFGDWKVWRGARRGSVVN